MDRLPLAIFLVFLIAFQACLSGFSVCSSGGSCHVETAAAHVHDEYAGEGVHEEHEGGDLQAEHAGNVDHDHSALVNAAAPHSHFCTCTDLEIDGCDAVPGSRDVLPTPAPDAYVPVVPVHDYRPSIASIAQVVRARARNDAAALERLALVRSTRLLL